MSIATARAYPNIALVKYWGKRDETLMLPAAGSLSLTLDSFPTTTTVRLSEQLDADTFTLNGAPQTTEALARVTKFLSLVRERAAQHGFPGHSFAEVHSVNTAPTGAGLASSASGFAALAVSAAAAYGLRLDRAELSRLARRGSGSAARSLISGISVWHAGEDDQSSFAEPVPSPEIAMVIATVDPRQKAVSSRVAMRETALTSPFYPAWITSTEQSLRDMIAACQAHDFTRIGKITEMHALRMHAVIQTNDPPVRYLSPTSIAIFDAVAALRERGIEAYATADAGPNVAVISRPEDVTAVASALTEHGEVHIAHAGAGAHLIDTPQDTPISLQHLEGAA